jgi:hypothetical protein
MDLCGIQESLPIPPVRIEGADVGDYRCASSYRREDEQVVVWAALIAGVVALIGFLVNGSLNRATEKRKTCADALTCIERYAQLPFQFRRRVDDSSETKAKLGDLLSSVQVDLAFYKRWLLLEDAEVAEAYRKLAAKYEAVNHKYREEALRQQPGQVEVPRDQPAHYEAEGEWKECIRLMRRHIGRMRLAFWRA